MKSPDWQRGEASIHEARRNKGEGQDLRMRRNEAHWNRARRPQGIPSLNHGAAAHPTTIDSGSAAGPGLSTYSQRTRPSGDLQRNQSRSASWSYVIWDNAEHLEARSKLKNHSQEQGAKISVGVVAMVPEVWSEVKMSRHHLLEGISQDYKVLWVAPPVYVHDLVQLGIHAARTGRGLIKLSNRFWSYGMSLPAGYRMNWKKKGIVGALGKLYEKIWQKAFVWKLTGILRSMQLDECILYIWRPEYAWMVGRLGESCLVYHMVDEYSFDPEKDHPIPPDEQRLIEDSDLVVIHSQSLFEKKGHINPNTHILPNGVDFERYRAAVDRMDPEPPELRSLPKPRIGYMGFIKRHLDLHLVIELATAMPNSSFVMVGPIRENHADIREALKRLKQMPNVHFTGSVAAADLPRYVKTFDVAIMPYKKTLYTKYIYPLKLHEYLSVGVPVVSTHLQNLTEFAEVVSFAEGRDEWVSAIELCIRENDAAKAAARVAVASRNSWRGRVAALSDMIRDALEKARNRRRCSLHDVGDT